MANNESVEKFAKEKLLKYNENDVYFLKSRWRDLIKAREYEALIRKTGANPQVVYDILKNDKIKSIRLSEKFEDRYEVTIRYHPHFDICIVICFDQPSLGKLGIVTYYKHKTRS